MAAYERRGAAPGRGARRSRRGADLAALALALGMAASAVPAAAQGAATRAHADLDSAAAVRAARDAQAAFERRRRALLPESHGGSRCDVEIGRWCYWYDEEEPHVPGEPARIAAARDRLVAELARAAARAPGDPWIAGQRVRYLAEAGRAADAAQVARACVADEALCAALLGFALHRGADPGGAERAFRDALHAMPADSACRWLDPRPLVPRADRGAFGPPCARDDTLVDRFWHLATPFLVRDGNDRRNEHLARRVLARLLADSRTPYGDLWSADLEEMTVRYGWPDRWSRHPSPSVSAATVVAVGHEPWPSYRFTPSVDALVDPRASEAPSIRDPRAHERAAPPATRWIDELPLAASAFRRGDSLLVVAVAPPPPDSARAAYDSAALVVAGFGGARSIAYVPLDSTRVAARVPAPHAPALVGLEAVGDSAFAVRARGYVEPPPTDAGFGVSDLLLFEAAADGAVPGSLDDALRVALPGRVAVGRTVGVFWELYGLGDGAHAVQTALFVESAPPGWLSRTLARMAGRAPASPPRLRWTDVGAGGAVAPRSVLLDAGTLGPGRHELVLEVRHADGRTVRVRVALLVTDDGS